MGLEIQPSYMCRLQNLCSTVSITFATGILDFPFGHVGYSWKEAQDVIVENCFGKMRTNRMYYGPVNVMLCIKKYHLTFPW